MAATPLGALARGFAAGVAGTVAMTGYQLAVQKLRSTSPSYHLVYGAAVAGAYRALERG